MIKELIRKLTKEDKLSFRLKQCKRYEQAKRILPPYVLHKVEMIQHFNALCFRALKDCANGYNAKDAIRDAIRNW